MVLMAVGLFIVMTAGGSECLGAEKSSAEVMARWGKKVITKQDVLSRLEGLPAEYRMRIQTEDQLREFLENFVQMEIIAAEAKAQKLDKDKVIATRMADTSNSILAQEYIKKKIANVKKPTDKEIEAYYQSHTKEYVVPAQVKAQHILLRTEADAKPEAIEAAKGKAEGIRKELLAGGDFAKLAEKYSDDPGSKTNGGDLGFFTRDKMIPEFAEAAFNMKKDEISLPVKTGYGFHIIKVTDITPEKQMDLQEAKPGIQASMENSKREAIVEKELERLKKKYNVRISNPAGTKE